MTAQTMAMDAGAFLEILHIIDRKEPGGSRESIVEQCRKPKRARPVFDRMGKCGLICETSPDAWFLTADGIALMGHLDGVNDVMERIRGRVRWTRPC